MDADAHGNFEEQYEEIEALQSIFMEEELEILEEKPYKFEITINSNGESAEKNYIKLKAVFDLHTDYPHQTPVIRIKNLSPDILDNNNINQFDKLVA